MLDPNMMVPAVPGQECLTIGYPSRLLRFPWLTSDIITTIINEKHPPQLSAERLIRLALSSQAIGSNS